jgi:hypothetical protein
MAQGGATVDENEPIFRPGISVEHVDDFDDALGLTGELFDQDAYLVVGEIARAA